MPPGGRTQSQSLLCRDSVLVPGLHSDFIRLQDGETEEHYPFSTSNQDPSYCGGVGCNYYGSGDKYLPAENNLAGVHPEDGGGGPELCCKSSSWLKLPPRLLPFDDTAPSSRPVAPGADLRPLLRIPEHSTSILEACHGHAPIARLRTPQESS